MTVCMLAKNVLITVFSVDVNLTIFGWLPAPPGFSLVLVDLVMIDIRKPIRNTFSFCYVLILNEGAWTVVVVCEGGPAAYYPMVGVDAVDGEVVDRGCGGVGADVADPDRLSLRVAELVP